MGIDVDFKDVYNYFSKNGTLAEGRLGTNPVKVVKFLNDSPEVKDVTIYTDENDLGKHDSYILVYGGAFSEKSPIIDKSGHEFHYQQFNKDDQGINIMSNSNENIACFEEYLDNRLNVINGYIIIGIDKDETYGLPGMMLPNGLNPNTEM